MKSECLPFAQVPHTTKLFSDFLSYQPSVRRFYPHSPFVREWLGQANPHAHWDGERRRRVADVLERQNRTFGSGSKTLDNIGRFRAGACVAVTGQQVGLFGGPAFSLYKALTAVRLAEEATAAGVDCVPVFWLAAEDHDLAEVNQATLPGPEGALARLTTPTQGVEGAPVGAIRLGTEIEAVVAAAASLLGDGEVSQMLRETYRPGESLGSAFALLSARLFADWGVILLDASDPEVDAIAAPIYRAAAERAHELDEALLRRGEDLEAAGYHQQVKVTPASTLLFSFHDGARTPVHRRVNGRAETVEFTVGEETMPAAELLRRIAESPQNFSANVLLRPVLQDFLLPTLVYTGGAAEVAYFAQVAVVYEKLLGRVTPVVPRFSATLVEAKQQRLLERYGLSLRDLFHGPERLREKLAEHALPADLQAAFEGANQALAGSLAAISEALARLDATLVEASKNTSEKMHYQLSQLQARAARAELRQTEVLNRHADLLSHTLFPAKALQEREISGMYFLARHGRDLLKDLYQAIHTDCLDHQVVYLSAAAE